MQKRTIGFIIFAIGMVALTIIAIWNFNCRFDAQPDIITCEMTFKRESEDRYYIYDYNGNDFVILKDGIDKFNLTNINKISIIMVKTNNLLLYCESGLNKNASIIWRNGILFIMGDVYER